MKISESMKTLGGAVLLSFFFSATFSAIVALDDILANL